MDATCKIQGSIHVFRLVNNMCPGKWVHIIERVLFVYCNFLGSLSSNDAPRPITRNGTSVIIAVGSE